MSKRKEVWGTPGQSLPQGRNTPCLLSGEGSGDVERLLDSESGHLFSVPLLTTCQVLGKTVYLSQSFGFLICRMRDWNRGSLGLHSLILWVYDPKGTHLQIGQSYNSKGSHAMAEAGEDILATHKELLPSLKSFLKSESQGPSRKVFTYES